MTGLDFWDALLTAILIAIIPATLLGMTVGMIVLAIVFISYSRLRGAESSKPSPRT